MIIMKCSIIIPTYNYGKRITHAIESAINQLSTNDEILIIDDGSTDETEKIISPFINNNPHQCRYIKKKHSGVAATRNVGIQQANGTHFLFLDADDRLLPGALNRFREALEKWPQAALLCAGHLSIEENGQVTSHPFHYLLSSHHQDNFIAYLRKKFSLVNGATLFNRCVFEKITYPEIAKNGEDISVFAQSLALFPCKGIKEPAVAIYKHHDSLRHHFKYQETLDIQIADLIFDKQLLPTALFAFKREYTANRLLSLFRMAYRHHADQKAKQYYQQAIKMYPRAIFKLAYLSKYLRLRLGFHSSQSPQSKEDRAE